MGVLNVSSRQKTSDMTFDCIIMNPPYNRNLHLKILTEAITHLKDSGNMVSLQPIVKWQQAKLLDKDIPVQNTSVCFRVSMDEASSIFGSKQRCELGIVSNGSKNISVIDNYDLLKKLHKRLLDATEKGGLLIDKLQKETLEYPVHFGFGATVSGHGGHGKACYRFVGMREDFACRNEEVGHSRQFNASNKQEQHTVWKTYGNTVLRFILKEFGFGGIPYDIIPWLSGFEDRNGKTPFDYEWTDDDFRKFFGITDSEWKTIETTMEKYK